MNDPKFGYAWIWLLPVISVMSVIESIKEWRRILRIRRIMRDNPDIKELVDRARK